MQQFKFWKIFRVSFLFGVFGYRYKLYVKMVTEGLTHLEEQKNSQCEQSEEPRTGDSAAAAVDMGQ